MRDSARQRAERFELAGRESFGLRFLALADIAKENRDAAVASIRMHVVPNLAGRVGRFEFDGDLFGHDALIVPLENRADELRKLLPEHATEDLVAFATQHRFGLSVDVGHLPIGIDGKKSIRRFLENVCHGPRGFDELGAGLITLHQFTNLAFGHGNSNAQQAEVERFGEIIVGACFQRLLQVFRVGFRRDQEDKHRVAVGARPQFAAKIDAAFSGQHPVEDQEGEALRSELGFGFLGAADGGHVMTALGDKPLQIAAAAGMIFDKQNFHLGEAKNRHVGRASLRNRRHFAQAE